MVYTYFKQVFLALVLLLGVPSFCFGMEAAESDSSAQVSFPLRVCSGFKTGTRYVASTVYEHPKLVAGTVLSVAGTYGIYRLLKYLDFASQKKVGQVTSNLQGKLEKQTASNVEYLNNDAQDTQRKIEQAKEKSKAIESKLSIAANMLTTTEKRAEVLHGQAVAIQTENSQQANVSKEKFDEYHRARAKQAVRLKSLIAAEKNDSTILDKIGVAADQNLKVLAQLQQQFSLLQKGIAQKLINQQEAQTQLENIQEALRAVNAQLEAVQGQVQLADIPQVEMVTDSDSE